MENNNEKMNLENLNQADNNQNNIKEEQVEQKKNNGLTIVLMLIIIALSGYIIYDKLIQKNDTEDNNKLNNNQNEETNNNEKEEDNSLINYYSVNELLKYKYIYETDEFHEEEERVFVNKNRLYIKTSNKSSKIVDEITSKPKVVYSYGVGYEDSDLDIYVLTENGELYFFESDCKEMCKFTKITDKEVKNLYTYQDAISDTSTLLVHIDEDLFIVRNGNLKGKYQEDAFIDYLDGGYNEAGGYFFIAKNNRIAYDEIGNKLTYNGANIIVKDAFRVCPNEFVRDLDDTKLKGYILDETDHLLIVYPAHADNFSRELKRVSEKKVTKIEYGKTGENVAYDHVIIKYEDGTSEKIEGEIERSTFERFDINK